MQPSGELIGLLTLVGFPMDGGAPEVHLGYLLRETAWGKGYASELIDGVLMQARLNAPLTLIGGVAKGNGASAHILRKQGFLQQPDQSDDELEVFALTLKDT